MGEIYGKLISDIVDNTENKEIRNLIEKEEYEKAIKLVKEMLNINKTLA